MIPLFEREKTMYISDSTYAIVIGREVNLKFVITVFETNKTRLKSR
jgi:hypothetical protein